MFCSRAAALALALIPFVTLAPVFAAEPAITVSHPWLRATPKTAPVVGGYATITNKGSRPDALLSASLPIAPEGQIHTMTMTNGVMEMRRLADGLAIPAGATVTLKPGGNHLMFMKPTAQLKQGQAVSGTLTFRDAGTIPVTFTVGGMAAKSAPGVSPDGSASRSGMHGDAMEGMDMKSMH